MGAGGRVRDHHAERRVEADAQTLRSPGGCGGGALVQTTGNVSAASFTVTPALGLTASGVVNIGGAYPAFKAGPAGDPSCIPTSKYRTACTRSHPPSAGR